MVTWRFKSTGTWHWQRLDTLSGAVLGEAHVGFATLRECVSDAQRHGYTDRYETVCDTILADPSISPDRLRPAPSTRY